jgi:hypothetical protein
MEDNIKKVWRLKDPTIIFTSKWGRVDNTTPSDFLGGMLKKCPELSVYIVEDGVEEAPKAKVTIKRVGDTKMVEPLAIEIETKSEVTEEVKEPVSKPKRVRKTTFKVKK